jgi:hypothetical protein
MSKRHEHAARGVYVLADSLDSILAACEDLLALADANQILRLELAAITHVLQARRHVEDLEVCNPCLDDQCALFLAGTAALNIARLCNISALEPPELPVSDNYKIGGRMPLGALAEFAGALLDALEAHFVLYDEEATPMSSKPPLEPRPLALTG